MSSGTTLFAADGADAAAAAAGPIFGFGGGLEGMRKKSEKLTAAAPKGSSEKKTRGFERERR